MVTSPQVSWLFFKARVTSISRLIRKERARRKNSQPAAARRVALKMGRRRRCSSVTYRFRYAPSSPWRWPILNTTTSPLYARRHTRLSASKLFSKPHLATWSILSSPARLFFKAILDLFGALVLHRFKIKDKGR
jgi:hypothetical protein